jgi:hypothetical protein
LNRLASRITEVAEVTDSKPTRFLFFGQNRVTVALF